MRKNITKRRKKNILLTSRVRFLLENPKELESLKPQARAKFHFDQREKVLDAIEYLTFMLKHLDERQQERIFKIADMKSFLEALLSLEGEDFEKRRKRILGLWSIILSLGANPSYTIPLVGHEIWRALTSRIDRNIQAIYYKTWH